MKYLITIGFCLVMLILVVGFILDFIGFYERMEKMEHYMDNDEYDYGHNVNHNEE